MSRKPAKPERKPQKTAVVAFKVESELAALLDKLPNKSDFTAGPLQPNSAWPARCVMGKASCRAASTIIMHRC